MKLADLVIGVYVLAMSALIMVDGVFDWATGSALLFVGINPLLKVWVGKHLLKLRE